MIIIMEIEKGKTAYMIYTQRPNAYYIQAELKPRFYFSIFIAPTFMFLLKAQRSNTERKKLQNKIKNKEPVKALSSNKKLKGKKQIYWTSQGTTRSPVLNIRNQNSFLHFLYILSRIITNIEDTSHIREAFR